MLYGGASVLIAAFSFAIWFATTQPPADSGPATTTDSTALQGIHANFRNDWREAYDTANVSKALGYWVGQQTTLDRIAKEFPSLSRRATSQSLDAEGRFGEGIAAIDKYYGERDAEWGRFRESIPEHLAPLLSAPMSEVEASAFLDEMDQRLKGAMPSPIRETILSFQSRFNARPDQEFVEGFRQELLTEGNPRAKGVQLMMQYPMSWVTKEPRRPNVAASLRSHGGHGEVTVLVLVLDMTADEIDEIKRLGMAGFVDSTDIEAAGGTFAGSGEMKVAGRAVPWAKYFKKEEVVDVHVKLVTWAFHLVQDDKYVTVQFVVGQGDMEPARLPSDVELLSRLSRYEPLFKHMLASLDFKDRYRRAPQ